MRAAAFDSAGSNTTADHVRLLELAPAQLPVDPAAVEMVARADSAALTHDFVNAVGRRRSASASATTSPSRSETRAWQRPHARWLPAVCADGSAEREGAEVAEITDLVDLSLWPVRTRAIARRTEPHPGAQLTFTDADGLRYQVFITDLPDTDVAHLEALQRGRGRAEKLICDLKANRLVEPSLRRLRHQRGLDHRRPHGPHDLLAWTRLVALDGDLARAEPRRLRYCLLHTAATIVRTGRRVRLRLAAGWPWSGDLVAPSSASTRCV